MANKNINFSEVGTLIYCLRETQNLSQSEFAHLLGVSKAAVSQWENGSGIKTERLFDIARYFNITFQELISGELKKEESDFYDRFYCLDKYENFEICDDNYQNLRDYLDTCIRINERFNRYLNLFLNDSLDDAKKDVLAKKLLCNYSFSDGFQAEIRGSDKLYFDAALDRIKELGKLGADEFKYELGKRIVFEMKIDRNSLLESEYDLLIDKYLSLIPSTQKDMILTKYVFEQRKNANDLEKSQFCKRLLNHGSRIVFSYENIWKKGEFYYDKDDLLGMEGRIVTNHRINKMLNRYYKNGEYSVLNTSLFDVSYNDYGDFIDVTETENLRALIELKDKKPSEYIDYLYKRDAALLHKTIEEMKKDDI